MPSRRYHPRCRVVLRVLLEDFAGGQSEDLHTFDVVPRSSDVTRNTHRQADRFALELDYRDFPIDPRTLRSVLVAVYLGDVGATEYELALQDRSRLAFLGYADEPETTLGGNGETVRLEGRDYTSLFLDHKWTSTSIDIARGLQQVVEEIAAAVPGAEDMRIVFDPGTAATDLSTVLWRTIFATSPGDDAWTVLVDLCGRAGLIPVVDLDRLRIVSPGTFGSAEAVFVYGHNVERLTYVYDPEPEPPHPCGQGL